MRSWRTRDLENAPYGRGDLWTREPLGLLAVPGNGTPSYRDRSRRLQYSRFNSWI